jgi:hypothetical protein
LHASRIAETSACAVGSFVEVTRFQPRPAILPFLTMTAPNGSPCFPRIFESESPMACRMNFSFMEKI